jgi:hypothetical protein
MSTLQKIQKANYLATEGDIEALAREYYESQERLAGSRTTYFRSLLAAVQVEIAGKPTLRTNKTASALTEEETAKHLEAFERVNTRLYAAVIRGSVTPDVADAPGLREEERRRRSLERNRRNNYARSAASTLRAHIRAGHDVTRISVVHATKNSMVVSNSTQSRLPLTDSERLQRRVKNTSSRLTALVSDLGSTDKPAAMATLQELMSEASALLLKFGGRTTTKADQAIAEHKLWKTEGGVFWPTATENRTQ